MLFKGKEGKLYEINDDESPLAKGGEGEIYDIVGQDSIVAKIFFEKDRNDFKLEKLETMVRYPLGEYAMRQVTWPIDILYDEKGFVGYIMSKIKESENLNQVCYNNLKLDWRKKIIVAQNLCVAIDSIHDAGHICGDLNPNNISVNSSNGWVTLMDSDSYHIFNRKENKTYRCSVGMPEYISKDIQEIMKDGYTLETAPLPTYTKHSDLFALAIHVFTLLMNGCHPFACALVSSEISSVCPQPVDNICNGNFTFINPNKGTTIPVYAPSLSILPENLRELFREAFVEDHMPSAENWYEALNQLKASMCSCNEGHFYYNGLISCPWCGLESKMSEFSNQNNLKNEMGHWGKQESWDNQENTIKSPYANPYLPNMRKYVSTVNPINNTYSINTEPPEKESSFKAFFIFVVIVVLVALLLMSMPDILEKFGKQQEESREIIAENYIDKPVQRNVEQTKRVLTAYKPESRVKSINKRAIGKSFTVPDSVKSRVEKLLGIVNYDETGTESQLYTAPMTGTYTFEFNLTSECVGEYIYINIYDHNNYKLMERVEVSDNVVTCTVDLKKDKDYDIMAVGNKEGLTYETRIFSPREVVDITGVSKVKDDIELENQKNIYKYTAPLSGDYNFSVLGENIGNFKLNIKCEETNEHYGEYSNLIGIPLKQACTYYIEIKEDMGKYTLNIDVPKETIDVSGYNEVVDCFQYTGQTNQYVFYPTTSGECMFKIPGNPSLFMVEVFESNGNMISEQIGNYIVANVKLSQKYNIKVHYLGDEVGSEIGYKMNIVHPRKVFDISDADVVNDYTMYGSERREYFIKTLNPNKYKFNLKTDRGEIYANYLILDGYNGREVANSNGSIIEAQFNANSEYYILINLNDYTGEYNLEVIRSNE